jgi:hypothetical protein
MTPDLNSGARALAANDAIRTFPRSEDVWQAHQAESVRTGPIHPRADPSRRIAARVRRDLARSARRRLRTYEP